jgi:Fe2+ or Zn2+ uptake regulation protein
MIIVTIIAKGAAGLNRNSKQKEAILKVVKGTASHPDAYMIYEQVKKEIPRISLGTVYRNLKQLKLAGIIREIRIPGDKDLFDGNMEPHYHCYCCKCGRIFDLDEKIDSDLEQRIRCKTGFQVTEQNLEISGICKSCQIHSRLNETKNE